MAEVYISVVAFPEIAGAMSEPGEYVFGSYLLKYCGFVILDLSKVVIPAHPWASQRSGK